MSYIVSILRTDHHGETIPLSLEEIDAFISINPEYEWKFIAHGPREITHKTTIFEFPVFFEDGEIWTKNPSDATLRVMIELANGINARVRGDDFETYKSPNSTYIHPDDRVSAENRQSEVSHFIKKRSRKRILVNGSIFIFFIVLILLVRFFQRH